MAKKFMKNINNGRVFEFNQNLMERNSSIFKMCDKDGVVAGEKLEQSNKALEESLDKAEENILEHKREMVSLRQEVDRYEQQSSNLQIELLGTKEILTKAQEENKNLKAEIKELKSLVKVKKK